MAKKLAIVFGIVFVLVGILGFISNPIVGSTNAYFQTDALHNIVHLLVGIVLLIAAGTSERASATSMIVFGVVYLVLAIDGFVQVHANGDKLLGLVTANPADTWLHVVLGIVLLIAGWMAKKGATGMSMDRTTV